MRGRVVGFRATLITRRDFICSLCLPIKLEWGLLNYDWIASKFENLQADGFLRGGLQEQREPGKDIVILETHIANCRISTDFLTHHSRR